MNEQGPSSSRKPISPLARPTEWEIMMKRVREADQQAVNDARQANIHRLGKRSSEIMISSEEDEMLENNMSFLKWLSPGSAAMIRDSMRKTKNIKTESPAKKRLNIA